VAAEPLNDGKHHHDVRRSRRCRRLGLAGGATRSTKQQGEEHQRRTGPPRLPCRTGPRPIAASRRAGTAGRSAPTPVALLDITRAALLIGVITISFAPVFVRLADTAPAAVAFYRMAYALPFVGVLWILRRSEDRRPVWAHFMACFAGLFLGSQLVLWHHSIEHIGAGIATLLGNTQVVFVGAVAWHVYRERPTNTALTVLPIVLAGAALLSGLGGADAYGDNPTAGAVLGLITAIGYSVFLLAFRHANRGLLAPSAGPLLDATAGAALAALIAVLIESGAPPAPTWPSHGWILALAVLTQTFAWLLIGFALPRLPALEVSVLLLLQPVGAIIWAHLIFDEWLSTVQWIGAAIVLAGILILGLSGSASPASEQTRQQVGDRAEKDLPG